MARAAGHSNARCAQVAGGPLQVAEDGFVHRVRTDARAVDDFRRNAVPFRHARGALADVLPDAIDYGLRRIAILHAQPGPTGHHVVGARIHRRDPEVPDGPVAALVAAESREVVGKGIQRCGRVPAQSHRRGARVIGLAREYDFAARHANDIGHESNPLSGRLQYRALFDVRLEVGGVPVRLEAQQLTPGIAGRLERAFQALAAFVREITHIVLVHSSGEHGAPQQAGEAAFFVNEGNDFDARFVQAAALDMGAGDFQPEDDTHGAVEPTALGHRVGVRTDQDVFAAARRAPGKAADTVNPCIQPGVAHSFNEPVAGGEVVGRERTPVDSGTQFAELRKGPQVIEHALGIDRQHGAPSVTGTGGVTSCASAQSWCGSLR